MHERQAIREAVVAMLKDAATDAGDRVFKGRHSPINRVELPAIAVYIENETVEDASLNTAPRELTRSVTVAIDAFVSAADKDAEKLDDTLDAIALAIETVMDGDVFLNGTAFTSVLTSTALGGTVEGRVPMGAVHLEYEVVYHTDLRTDMSAADEFNTVHADVAAVAGQDPDDQTEWLQTDIQE